MKFRPNILYRHNQGLPFKALMALKSQDLTTRHYLSIKVLQKN